MCYVYLSTSYVCQYICYIYLFIYNYDNTQDTMKTRSTLSLNQNLFSHFSDFACFELHIVKITVFAQKGAQKVEKSIRAVRGMNGWADDESANLKGHVLIYISFINSYVTHTSNITNRTSRNQRVERTNTPNQSYKQACANNISSHVFIKKKCWLSNGRLSNPSSNKV